jgi:hypothetical protein
VFTAGDLRFSVACSLRFPAVVTADSWKGMTMNLVNPPVVAGVIGGICSAAIGADYATPAIAAAPVVAASHITNVGAAVEASTGANALLLQVAERSDSAPLGSTTVCLAA